MTIAAPSPSDTTRDNRFAFYRPFSFALWQCARGWVALGLLLVMAGCGPIRVRVEPVAPVPDPQISARPGAVGYVIAPDLSNLVAQARIGRAIEGEYVLGGALAEIIKSSVQRAYPEAHPGATCTCTGPAPLLCLRLAKPPEVQIRWVQHMMSVGGGATVSLAAHVEARRCDTPQVWREVLVGYGSADHTQSLANSPDTDELQPAADIALRQFSTHLARFLAGIDLSSSGQREQKPKSEGGP